MNLKENYFNLCYTHRIHEFAKIDDYKKLNPGEAKSRFKSLDEFYITELGITQSELLKIREEFREFNNLYTKYYNPQRAELFSNPDEFMNWYKAQKESCHYCEVTHSELLKIVEKREGNLTLNKLTKRSKGTLEIERLDPIAGYHFNNSVLACPFCNNGKSNLISAADWRLFFVPAVKDYFRKLLAE